MDKFFVIATSILFFYSLSKIFDFWGISSDVYGIYVIFYVFIITSTLVLPLKPDTVI
jgi:hypothetical protein